MRKVVVYAPLKDADEIRSAITEAGGGKIANYSHATFSSKDADGSILGAAAHSATGGDGALQAAAEERIEFACDDETFAAVVAALKKLHPHVDLAIDSWPIDIA